MAFIEDRLAGDPTNWWAPNHSCILSLLRSCGLNVIATPGHEIYVATPDDSLTAVSKTWNKSEFLSAIGETWLPKIKMKVDRK
jgi:tRNA (mo5U34)-methyltransferase